MKWFKHDSDAHADAKLRKVRLKYGMQGYGLYWYCLELIARGVEKHRLTFELEHDAELIAHDTGISREMVEDMMRFMAEIGLFEQSRGVITCLKMATRTDEYTTKLLSSRSNVPIVSRQHPDSLGTKSVLLEEKRREEKRTDKKESGRRFTPPTRDELSCFVSLESLNVDPAAFIDHYESKGWLVGNARMKDWRAAARGWSRRQDTMPKPKTRGRSITEDLTDRSWAQ